MVKVLLNIKYLGKTGGECHWSGTLGPLANNLTCLGLRKMKKFDYISGFQMWLH